jgi:hypothetical protein
MSTGLTSGFGPTGVIPGLKSMGMRQVNLPTKNQGQMDLLNQLLSSTQSGLGQGGLQSLSGLASGRPESFEAMERPAFRQFAGLQGSLASRFSGMGSGARQSSGFQNTMGEAGVDLAERLAGNRQNLQQNALKQLLGLSESLLGQSTFDSFLTPIQKKKKLWQKLLGPGISLAGGVGGAFLGGPVGAKIGSQIGSGLGQAFSGD